MHTQANHYRDVTRRVGLGRVGPPAARAAAPPTSESLSLLPRLPVTVTFAAALWYSGPGQCHGDRQSIRGPGAGAIMTLTLDSMIMAAAAAAAQSQFFDRIRIQHLDSESESLAPAGGSPTVLRVGGSLAQWHRRRGRDRDCQRGRAITPAPAEAS